MTLRKKEIIYVNLYVYNMRITFYEKSFYDNS